MDQALLSSIPNSCSLCSSHVIDRWGGQHSQQPCGQWAMEGRYVPTGSIRQDSVCSSLSVLCLDAGRNALFQQAVHIHANSSPDALPWKEFLSRQLTNTQGEVEASSRKCGLGERAPWGKAEYGV